MFAEKYVVNVGPFATTDPGQSLKSLAVSDAGYSRRKVLASSSSPFKMAVACSPPKQEVWANKNRSETAQ